MATGISICSYSFHRLLAAGKQDVFQYITNCKKLGCTALDPWNGHTPQLRANAPKADASSDLKKLAQLSSEETAQVKKIKAAGDAVGLPFGCVAIDGAHIYDPDPVQRKNLRANAYRWLNIAGQWGATQARIDAGGPEKMTDEQFDCIIDGYNDLVPYAKNLGIELLIENHWGPSKFPANVEKILKAAKGLGLLFDTFNWAMGEKALGWMNCAKYARAMHIKTFAFDDTGEEVTENLGYVFRQMKKLGYKGTWGVESCPLDGDEMKGARDTIALIHKYVG